MTEVSGEGLQYVCTELPKGHRFKTAAQDQSQSESSASKQIIILWKAKKRERVSIIEKIVCWFSLQTE